MHPSSNTLETDPAVNTKIIHLESSPGPNSSLEPRVTLSALRGPCSSSANLILSSSAYHGHPTPSISMLRCHILHCPLSHLPYLFPSLLGAQPVALVPPHSVQPTLFVHRPCRQLHNSDRAPDSLSETEQFETLSPGRKTTCEPPKYPPECNTKPSPSQSLWRSQSLFFLNYHDDDDEDCDHNGDDDIRHKNPT